LKQRIVTGLIFGMVVLGLLLFSSQSRLVFLIAVPVLGFLEYAKITEFKVQDWIVSLLIVGAYASLCYFKGEFSQQFLSYTLVGINLVLMVNLFKPFLKLERSKAVMGSAYILLPFVLAICLDWNGPMWILMSAILLIWVADSAAYFVGSQIGKRKLFPSISPKKTWEGLWGSCMITLIAAYILYSYFQIGTWRAWVLLGLIVWGLGAIGDLIASQVKRYFKVKDSGNLLPGHGGFYDRFDSLIYILPFLIFLIEYSKILQ